MHAGNEAILAISIIAAHASMELSGLASDPLRDHFSVFIDKNGHQRAPRAAVTTFWPASPMFSAEMIGSPEADRIFFPRSSLVPFMRTTSGTESFTCLAAST